MLNIDRYLSVNVARYVIAVCAIGGNGFIIFLILRSKSLRRTHCNVLIAQLAVWEMFIGIGLFVRTTYSIHAIVAQQQQFEKPLCAVINMLIGVPMQLQHFTVVAIALNQLLFMCWPLKYRNEFNENHFITLLVVEVLGVIGVLFLSFYEIDTSKRIAVCTLAQSAGPHVRYTYMMLNSALIVMLVLYSITLLTFAYSTKYADVRRTVHRRVTTGILLVLFNYTICWAIMPMMSFIAWLIDDTQMASFSTVIGGFSSGINSSLSFFIYMLKHEEMRKCAKSLFRGRGITNISGVPSAAPSVFYRKRSEPFSTIKSSFV